MAGPKRRLVIGPAGIEKWADPDKLDQLPEGFTPASDDEQRQWFAKQKYGSIPAKIAAAGIGLGRSATLGLSDVALTEGAELIGGEGAKERMRASLRQMEEGAGGAMMAGEIGGLAAGMVGGAGKFAAKSALGKAVAATPGAAAIRGGAALEKALLRGGVRPGVAMAGRGAAEGAAFELGHTISEAALGNVDLNGEALFASMGTGLLYGGAGAGALAGVGSMLGRAGRGAKSALGKALDRGSKKASSEATERLFGHGTSALDDIARAEAEFGGDVKALITSRTPEGKAYRQLILKDALPMRDRMSRSLTEVGTKVEDDMSRFYRDFTQEGKHSSFGHLVSETDDAARYAAAEADNLLTQTDAMLDNLAGDVSNYGGEFGAKSKFVKGVRGMQAGIRDAVYSGGSVRDMRTASERLKRYLDNNAKSLGRSTASKTSTFHHAAAKTIEDSAHKWRSFLESEQAWGRAGTLQKSMNAALHDQFGHTALIERKLMTQAGNDPYRTYRLRNVFESGKVDSFAKQLVNPSGDTTRASLVNVMEARAAAADAVLTHGKLTSEQAKYLTRMRDNARALVRDVKETEGAVSRVAQLEELAKDEASEITLTGEFAGSVVNSLRGAAAVATGGGTVGAAETVGAALGGGTMGRARKLYALETLAERLRSKMDGSVGKVFSRAGKVAAEAGRGIPAVGGRAATYFAGETERGKRAETRRQEFENRARFVRNLDSQSASDKAKDGAAQVADAAPVTTVAAADTAARAQAYLAAQLPTDGVPGAVLGQSPQASATEIDEWMRKLKAVDDPASILDDLSDGKLHRDSVEAVKAVYPALYEQMRGNVMERINDMQAEGKELPYRERIDLGTLLELPTDPMLRPDIMGAIQGSYAPVGPQAQPPQQQEAPDLASAFETESEQTEKES